MELQKCEALGEYGFKTLFKELPHLKFVDLSAIPFVNYAFLDAMKNDKPDLLIKQFKIPEWNKKDNGLRMPRRVVEKKKKKKGKKGKKGKK